MRLSFSVAARERAFAKTIRRVRPEFDSLLKEFEALTFADPIHESILVGLTDDKDDNFFQVIPNNEGYFQVLIGCTLPTNDPGANVSVKRKIFECFEKAALACPFSAPDQKMVEALFKRWREANLE